MVRASQHAAAVAAEVAAAATEEVSVVVDSKEVPPASNRTISNSSSGRQALGRKTRYGEMYDVTRVSLPPTISTAVHHLRQCALLPALPPALPPARSPARPLIRPATRPAVLKYTCTAPLAGAIRNPLAPSRRLLSVRPSSDRCAYRRGGSVRSSLRSAKRRTCAIHMYL